MIIRIDDKKKTNGWQVRVSAFFSDQEYGGSKEKRPQEAVKLEKAWINSIPAKSYAGAGLVSQKQKSGKRLVFARAAWLTGGAQVIRQRSVALYGKRTALMLVAKMKRKALGLEKTHMLEYDETRSLVTIRRKK